MNSKIIPKIESYLQQKKRKKRNYLKSEEAAAIRQANKYYLSIFVQSKWNRNGNREESFCVSVWQVDLMHFKSIFSASMAHSNSRLSVFASENGIALLKNLCQVYFMLMKLRYDDCQHEKVIKCARSYHFQFR